MTRRTRATSNADDTGSLNESAVPATGRVKAEKGRQEKRESARTSKGKGKARRVESDDEDDVDQHDPCQAAVDENDAEEEVEEVGSGEEDEGTPKGRKRARVNEQGASVPASPSRPMVLERAKTLPRDDDGFIPGSIVRIQLCNFVTYDWVEFRPGPYLNMILGPNGTGKSSIACAIALGLNWSPSVLGRAGEINAFVKNDKDSGYIEIELKGAKGEKNLVIRRKLSAKSKGSTFTLNGQAATGKEINANMLRLNVQVGNLCAAKISILEVLIPVNEYHEAKERYMKAKEYQRELHARVTKLKNRNAPAHVMLEQLGIQYKELDKVREKKKNASKQKFQQMKTKWADSERLENEAEDITTKLDGLKRAEKDRLKKIKDMQSQIIKWQQEVDNPPELEDIQAINEEIRKLNMERNQTMNRMDDLQVRQRTNVDESAAEKAKISNAHDQLKRLDDERHRKLENLRKQDRDCADAVVWLRNNQDRFKMEVFEPPMVCCNVPDKRYTNMVEACFNINQLRVRVECFECHVSYKCFS
ncbi:hypothetical protein ID866_7768 [Astraeus odoratus]|nr:hypothetical protein ID866_7768 [Astraeus odoratus]